MSSKLIVNEIDPESGLTIDGDVITTGSIDSPDLKIDGTSLGEEGTIAQQISGASKIGVYNEFNSSGSSTVQEVLKDFDEVIDNNQQKVISGSGSPSVIPNEVGQLYVDTIGCLLYIAVGTSSLSDWIIPDSGLKLGYSFPGGISAWQLQTNHLHTTKVFAPFTTVIRRIGIYLQTYESGVKFIMGIYDDNDGSPGTLLGETDEYTTSNSGIYLQVFRDLIQPVTIVKDSIYWLAFHPSLSVYVERLKGTTNCSKYVSIQYDGSLPVSVSGWSNTYEMSISAW